jgi:threonine/homoserine/homoserine lactone efflux protein
MAKYYTWNDFPQVMPWESLAFLLVLLLAGLITPGPNNITCTVHAVVHGKKSNASLIAGMALGFISIHFACGFAVDSFDEDGKVRFAMDLIGSLFMFLIAFGILYLGRSEKIQSFPDVVPRLGFKTGVLMQYVNGKEWAMVFMVMTQFLEDFGGGIKGILTISTITTSGGIVAMIAWSNLGEKIKSKTDTPGFVKKAFTILGCLLLVLATLLTVDGLR